MDSVEAPNIPASLRHAAIDRDDLAGDEARPRRGEEQGGGGDLLGPAEALQAAAFSRNSILSGGSRPVAGDTMAPAAIAFARMPSRPTSRARALVNPWRAAFAAP